MSMSMGFDIDGDVSFCFYKIQTMSKSSVVM
jgi:hypothetical protein